MEENSQKTVPKAFRFPAELWSQLEVEVNKAGVSTSDFVRGALEEVLTNRAGGGWIPSAHWARWSALSEAAGYKSVVAWIDALIQKPLGGLPENRPNFSQPSLEKLTRHVEYLFQKEEGEVRHIELSATLETFVLLRLWLERQQPELIPRAHALAESHYREAKAKDKGQALEPVFSAAPISPKQPMHEMALS